MHAYSQFFIWTLEFDTSHYARSLYVAKSAVVIMHFMQFKHK